MQGLRVLACCVLSGILSALAFTPYDMPWLLWGALAPAMAITCRASRRHALLGGFVFGLAQALMLLRWFFGVFGPFAVVLYLIYALFFALYFCALQDVRARRGGAALLFAAAPLWVAVEFFRAECWRLRFAWFALGYAHHADPRLLQLASIGGVPLLSLLIAATNGVLAWALLEPRRWQRVAAVAAALCLVASAYGAGHLLLPAAGSAAAASLPVLGVEGEEEIVSFFTERSEAALGATRGALIVWPEYAVGPQLAEDSPLLKVIGQVARRHGSHVLFGATRAASGARPNNFENTLFLVDPQGALVGAQVKSVPVPFFVDGQAARSRAPLPFLGGKIGAAICYDMDFGYISRDLVRQGAELLVFPTMDAAHWGALQHRQHATLAPFRAVEHRRFVVRVGSSGISMLIDPWGRVVQRTGIGAPRILSGQVALRSDGTFYTAWGYYLPHLCMLFGAVLVLAGAVRPGRRGAPGA